MSTKFNQLSNLGTEVHFSQAAFGEVERSQMTASPEHLTTFDGGEIVPIYCHEILPLEVRGLDLDFVIRQMTLLTPTMGSLVVDFYAFWVPHRVVNQSAKAVFGENYNGSWTASSVSFAPLKGISTGSTQIPVCSVADYYGFPTQQPIPNSVLSLCHDLKFRGYVMIYNEFFRDQNYQPPIPMSTLNVYQGFLDNSGEKIGLGGDPELQIVINSGTKPDGSYPQGAVANAIYGSGVPYQSSALYPAKPDGHFRATSAPLKANKLHDYFTSVLPSAQKGPSVMIPATGGYLPVTTQSFNIPRQSNTPGLKWRFVSGGPTGLTKMFLGIDDNGGSLPNDSTRAIRAPEGSNPDIGSVVPSNLWAVNGGDTPISVDISDVRRASAIQQIYETLARGGSRYRSYIKSFFGIEVDDPFDDVPKRLGHFRRNLDLFQTAQTSASNDTSPQGNLAAFGYTSSAGQLFSPMRFLEHGYIHVFAVVRHKNVYCSPLARDNFRLSLLDYYHPQLANISEQPVYRYEINPFASSPTGGFGFQEAWSEYRFEPDVVSGRMRPGLPDAQSIAIWNYADDFDSTLSIADGDWLKSNTKEVVSRTTIVQENASQFKAQFKFKVWKDLPMPTYSVPGMDII